MLCYSSEVFLHKISSNLIGRPSKIQKNMEKILSFLFLCQNVVIDYLIYTFESDQGCVIHFTTIKDYLMSGSCALGVGLRKMHRKTKISKLLLDLCSRTSEKMFFPSHLPLLRILNESKNFQGKPGK